MLATVTNRRARRAAQRRRDRAILATAQFLGMACLVLCSVPAAVLFGMAIAESARLMGAN